MIAARHGLARWVQGAALALAVALCPSPARADAVDDAFVRGNEAAEAANLARIATVTRTQAEQTALGRVPGTVNDATLGDENGTAIWEVHVKADSGRDQEVKVNAKTGTVLPLEADAGN